MKKRILVFGNELIQEDSIALKIAKKLEKELKEIEFIKLNGIEEIEDYGKELILMDAVKGIKKVKLITDLNKIEFTSGIGLHDFDLAMQLKLLKKINKIKSVKVIGIPINYSKKTTVKEIKKIIKTL